MNRLVIKKHKERENDQLVINDPIIIDHGNNILKLKVNDTVKLCLLDKGQAIGLVKEISSSQLKIQIKSESPGTNSFCHLQIGLCRPPSMKKILEHGTSLGVNNFEFFKGELSEKSYMDSQVLKKAEQYLTLGLAQSGEYYVLPKVNTTLNFPKVDHHQKFFLSFNTDQYLNNYQLDFNIPMTFALGPERGWTDKEEKFLIEEGYKPIKIAESILRVEIATFALLGQLHLLKNNI